MVSFFKEARTVPRSALFGEQIIPIILNNFVRSDAHLKGSVIQFLNCSCEGWTLKLPAGR